MWMSLILIGSASPVCAAIESQLAEKATVISKVIQGAGHDSAMLDFKGPTGRSTSGGTLVQQILSDELSHKGIRVEKLSADIQINVKMTISQSVQNGLPIITLAFEFGLTDTDEKPVGDINSKLVVTNRNEIARITGIPLETPNDSVGKGLVPAISVALRKPEQKVNGPQGTVIRARDGGQFGMEVLVKDSPRPVSTVNGLAFVDLKQEDKCKIRLINDADYTVAVELTLDGLNSFHFSPDKKNFWLVPPKNQLVIGGWQINEKDAEEFMIVPLAESAAAKANSIGNVGVISAGFYRAYSEGETIPESDDPEFIGHSPSVGFGTGATIDQQIRRVKVTIGANLRGLIPVRYSKPAL